MKKNKIPVSYKDVTIKDKYWKDYIALVKNVVIPYQWDALNDRVPDSEPSHCIENFKIAAGISQGEFYGMVFQDSDIAKWLEAVGYVLGKDRDSELEKIADEAIDIIAAAQQEDGYLNTYFTVKEPEKRWTNLRDWHELYCAGHMIEAAVAYYEATGKRKLLDVVCKFADYIDTVFGMEEGKRRGYPGHAEIELALVKLYRVTGNKKYLNLSQYFIKERGQHPNYFNLEEELRGDDKSVHDFHKNIGLDYYQAHKPVVEQETAEGHSVRAVYLYSGMLDVALETGDKELIDACKTLWNNIVGKRMYVTGGIGSTSYGEAFTFDYDLPNDTIYAETCAAIGLIFFAHRLLQMDVDSKYSDIMELALYNAVISGMSLDGKKFFYVNPLEVLPEASEKDPTKKHVKATRQSWFACACCPPNVSRLLASLGEYIYSTCEDEAFIHLYMDSETNINVLNNNINIIQETDYPWEGTVSIIVNPENDGSEFTLSARIPGWCQGARVTINGEEVDLSTCLDKGYVKLRKEWIKGDKIEIILPMEIRVLQANPNVRENIGKVAIQRGPFVYCLEEEDNGVNLHQIVLSDQPNFTSVYEKEFLGGVVTILGDGYRYDNSLWDNEAYELYRPRTNHKYNPVTLKFIPYYAWANRGLGEMMVWVRERS